MANHLQRDPHSNLHSNLHLHLDLVGGLAGDMFAAAMLDTFADLAQPLQQDLTDAGLNQHVSVTSSAALVNGLQSTALSVQRMSDTPRATGHYSDIRARLQSSDLNADVLERALAIFEILADAESQVHQVPIDKVHFHEIADWDSIADIVAAASLLTRSQIQSFSCSPVPAGSGFVNTEHGKMPVPAPATTILLRGFELYDDGISGERVTPTGAAILRHCIGDPALASASRPSGRLVADGSGCGNRRFEAIPNIVRLLAIERSSASVGSAAVSSQSDRVGQLTFEIDDMTPEELAIGLDQLRAGNGVRDVSYQLRYGKKGRAQFAVQVLCDADQTQSVADLCFHETSTLGIRAGEVTRQILTRESHVVTEDQPDTQGQWPVKSAHRPGGVVTSKVEADALSVVSGLTRRRQISAAAERSAASSIRAANKEKP